MKRCAWTMATLLGSVAALNGCGDDGGTSSSSTTDATTSTGGNGAGGGSGGGSSSSSMGTTTSSTSTGGGGSGNGGESPDPPIQVSNFSEIPGGTLGFLATNDAGDILIAGSSEMKILPAGSSTWGDLPLGGLKGGQHGGFFFGPGDVLYSSNCGGDVIALGPSDTSWRVIGKDTPGFACTDGLLRTADGKFFMGADITVHGVYSLADENATWTLVGTGLDFGYVNQVVLRKNGDLLAATTKDGVEVLVKGTTEWEFFGTDGPSTYTADVIEAPDETVFAIGWDGARELAPGTTAFKDISEGYGNFDGPLVVDSANHVFAMARDSGDGKMSLVTRATGAASWTKVTTIDTVQHCISLIPDGKGGLLADCEGHVYKSAP